MSAHDAVSLYGTIAAGGIRCWVMGGWGVDAVLRAETRPHHDLDLLVSVEDLGALLEWFASHGFSRNLIWAEENRWVNIGGISRPTAFVEVDGSGREIDVHVVELIDHAAPRVLCDVPWRFDDRSLEAVGVIAGNEVRCVSAKTQLQMHTGYELPPEHERDADRLARFLEAGGGA